MAKRHIVTKKQEREARAIVQRAMNQQREREIAAKKALVGKYFKYRNSYSDGEWWWLYALVTGVDSGGRILTSQFQRTSMGHISLSADEYGGLLPDGGWIEIGRDEFRVAIAEIAGEFLRRLGESASSGARQQEQR